MNLYSDFFIIWFNIFLATKNFFRTICVTLGLLAVQDGLVGRILLSIGRAPSQSRGAYSLKTIESLVSLKQPTNQQQATKCVFSSPSSSSTSWASGSQCHPSCPTAVDPTTAPAARTTSSRTSPGCPPSSPAPPSARTSPSASTSRTTWTGTATTRAPATSSPPAQSRGLPTGSGCPRRSPASLQQPPSPDIWGIGRPGIVYNWPPGASNVVQKNTWGTFLCRWRYHSLNHANHANHQRCKK